jgi:2-amino-4-hydroxy-6-hydroxymethyldihydropteridine diphosphokinase
MISGDLTAFQSTAYVGLGSNLDNPIEQVQSALREIDEIYGVALVKVSSMYASAPVGMTEQPPFVNAVAEVVTTLSPHDLMSALLSIEARHHRERRLKNGPRTLDLDIVLFNDWEIDDDTVTTPHPRFHERAFVLVPLHELRPDLIVPGHGAIAALLAGVAHQDLRRLASDEAEHACGRDVQSVGERDADAQLRAEVSTI